MSARRTYSPTSWSDIERQTRRMRIDMLKDALEGANCATFAAEKIGLSRNNFVSSCRRLGVPIDHLLNQDHPRWGGRIRERVSA